MGTRSQLGARATLGLAPATMAGASCSGRPAFDTLRAAIHSDPISHDPHPQNEILAHSVWGNVDATATTLARDVHVRPGLAIRESSDDLTCRRHIQPGASLGDGRPVEAAYPALNLDPRLPAAELTSGRD